jgi:CubicO group peptidase (beta-lactamase class C family)
MRLTWCLLAVSLSSAAASAQPLGFNLDAVTLAARGMIDGVGVDERVPGFEIRILQAGRPVYHQAFGAWSIDRPANTDSSTKTVSGAMIMAASEHAGAGFSLDSRLADFLPAFDVPGKRQITVRQAFSHTSGLAGEDVSSLILANPNLTLQQSASLIAQLPLDNGPPGSGFAYGGLSMQAAGAAMEVATDTPFRSFFDQRIAQPLGLTQTRFVLTSDINPRVAGGIESTATDFGRFIDMLVNDGVSRATGQRVLSQASRDAMITRQVADDVDVIFSPLPAETPFARSDYGVGTWLLRPAPADPVELFLAAGARGFHAFGDEARDMVFVFSSELTRSSNVVPFTTSAMYDALKAALASPLTRGDTDANGIVDFADLLTLSQNFNRADRLWSQGDFTGDGRVGFNDLLALAQNYGEPDSFASDWATARLAVPEPSGIGLLLVSLGTLLRRRV